jgi:hypothetical protein
MVEIIAAPRRFQFAGGGNLLIVGNLSFALQRIL